MYAYFVCSRFENKFTRACVVHVSSAEQAILNEYLSNFMIQIQK